MSDRDNIASIVAVYEALEEIAAHVVFVGGTTVSLYADRAALEVRPTDDVDLLVEVAGYAAYADIEVSLQKKGFSPDQRSKVICRYIVRDIIVDVMPTDESILGFSNRWYKEAFAAAIDFTIDPAHTVRILSPVYFVATKLEAFKSRGNNDGRMSTDFEDLVYIFNNRTTIWEEMAQANTRMKVYLKEVFANLLAVKYIHEWVGGHLDFHEQKRADYILGHLQEFVAAAD